MKTSEILCRANCDPVLNKHVLDVCAANRIPKHIRRGAIIANTDDDTKAGRHWCAIYFLGDGTAEFFDSYGRTPGENSKRFVRSLRTNSSSFVYNTVRLQNDVSNACGQFCLYYIYHRLRGVSMKDIVKQFRHYPNNDYYVNAFVERAFPCCLLLLYHCVNNQSCIPL